MLTVRIVPLHDVLSLLQAPQHGFLVLRPSLLLDLAVAQLLVLLRRLGCQMIVIFFLITLSFVVPLCKSFHTYCLLLLTPCGIARAVLNSRSWIDAASCVDVLDSDLLGFSDGIKSRC